MEKTGNIFISIPNCVKVGCSNFYYNIHKYNINKVETRTFDYYFNNILQHKEIYDSI